MKYWEHVWQSYSNTKLHILNNIIHIFTHIFTYSYIKNTQTTLLKLTYQTLRIPKNLKLRKLTVEIFNLETDRHFEKNHNNWRCIIISGPLKRLVHLFIQSSKNQTTPPSLFSKNIKNKERKIVTIRLVITIIFQKPIT